MSSRPDFDAQAARRHERRLARAGQLPWLHEEVARRMAERLTLIRRTPTDIVVWDSLETRSLALSGCYPKARIQRVEPSALDAVAALASAQVGGGSARRAPWARWWGPKHPQAHPVCQPENLPAGQSDLLWSNLWLHRCADFQQALSAWQRALRAEGFVMFSFLGPGTLTDLTALYARQGWPAPLSPLVDMHDVGDMLVEAGFADPVMDQETLTLTWSDGAAALQEIRSWGGNTATRRFPGLRTPRWRQQLMAQLEARAAQTADGPRVSLSVEVVYGHAFKPQPRHPVAPETRITLDDFRSNIQQSQRRG